MRKVRSKDSTAIAFDQLGQGPAIILVGGAFTDRSQPTLVQLAARLSPHFTVFNYDRRGRGDSVTRRRMRSSVRSKISKPSLSKLVDRCSCAVFPPVRPLPSRHL